MTGPVDRVFDEVLLMHAQAGNQQALERLAGRWRPRHYAHARRLLNTADQAGDAVQDAWIGIIRGLWRLRDTGRFPAWSYAIVTRRCQDILRRALRASEQELGDELATAVTTDPGDARDLRAGLRSLPPEQRAAIALFYREGLTVGEIAEAMAIPEGTVKTRLFHARRTLRQFFEGD